MVYSISETAKLNNLRPYYYFKYILTELPKLCEEKENIDPEKLDYLMPWSDSLPTNAGSHVANNGGVDFNDWRMV